ncbi:hypothetical protein ZHAS_00004907 [Anopheles sinensis]|uniref:Peptidase S1 domain-containing protein n=1 Tax=Anopheles sinensis TaxID=74873 RepID=A0A084VI73_ANOSI|nr:hypothetical protein ZHAS_00004907 [Anopheles sinensis]
MSEPIENVQVMQVANIVIHPEFRPANGSNDIAIVRLSSDIDFTHSVRPVCIWDGEDDVNHIVGSSGTMIGFGLNEEYRGSETLQEATVTVVNHLNCLLKDPHTYAEVLNHNMFCAGAKNNVSACNGDSGGGLFFNIHGTWYLRGIVSSIPGLRDGTRMFCDFTKYTIFTDVSKFRTWILRFTNTAKWLNELKPCQDSVIDENTMCNAAYRHDHGFLVFGIDKYVHRISLSDGQHIRTVENFAGFTVDIKPDCAEGRLYMKNSMNAFIYSMNYDGTDKRIFKSTRSSLSLAVDWISRRLYWSEIFQRTIHVARLDNPDVRTVLLTNVVAYTIAIDPHQGKLYWASVKDFIEWSNLDGTDRQVLIKLQRVTPYILISMSTGELCHSGVYTKIECIDTRTKRTHAVVKSNTVSHFPNLAITEKHLYWTEYPCDK